MSLFAEVKQATRYKWQDILPAITGVPSDVFTRKNKPCPLCGGSDRFWFSDDNPKTKDGGVGYWGCRGNCKGGDGFNFIAKSKGIRNEDAIKLVAEFIGLKRHDYKNEIQKSKFDTLKNVWESCVRIVQTKKTPAQKYLESRGILLGKNDDPDIIGMHPNLEFKLGKEEAYKLVGIFPAIVANFAKPDGDGTPKIVGQSWIYLTEEGRKCEYGGKAVKRFRSSGYESVMGGAAVYIDDPIDGVIGVAEGLETALYCRQSTGIPMWSCGTAGLLEKVEIPDDVHTVIIFGDNDSHKMETGQKAAESLAKRLISEERRVKILIPEQAGQDWLDAKTLTRRKVDDTPFLTSLNDFFVAPSPIADTDILPDVIPEYFLPQALRGYVSDIASGLQVPIGFPAVTMLSLLSSVVCSACAIKPKRHEPWFEEGNLFGFLVGMPSTKKSEVIKQVFAPLMALDEIEQESYRTAQLEYKSLYRRWKAKCERLEKEIAIVSARKSRKEKEKDKAIDADELEQELSELEQNPPDKPIERVLIAGDSSPERFIEMLNENKRGFVVLQDEIILLFESFNKEGREGMRQLILSCYNGAYSKQHRLNNVNRIIRDAYCSIFGGIQPDVLSGLMKADRRKTDGLMSRFQLVFYAEDIERGAVDRPRKNEHADQVAEVIKRLCYSDYMGFGAIVDDSYPRPYFVTDDDAYAYFMDWEKEQNIKCFKADVSQKASIERQKKLLLTISLLLHVVKVATRECKPGPVNLSTIEMAGLWVSLLEQHLRYLGTKGSGGNINFALSIIADKLRSGELSNFTYNKLIGYGWDGVDKNRKEAVFEALAQLEEANWIFKEELDGGKSGRYWQYSVNPRVIAK